jgi:hypothetical protein
VLEILAEINAPDNVRFNETPACKKVRMSLITVQMNSI